MLTLYYHPLSSYCHKVLIAIDSMGIDVEKRLLDLGDAAQRDAFLALWPMGKIPLLVADGRPVPETSIIIEHLQRHHATGSTLIPHDPVAALDVRFWDRFFDHYVMAPMQALTADLLRPQERRDPRSVEQARQILLRAFELADAQLGRNAWLAGSEFSMADCAAAPALFYAVTYVPIPADHPHLAAYFDRLVDHPSVAATIEQARPYFKFYPGRAGLAPRFFVPGD